MAQPALALINEDEYLSFERNSHRRHEYVDGRIFAMTGGSRHHNFVTGNMYTALRAHLRGRPCSVFVSDMRVRVASARVWYYPDVVVSCDARDREDSARDVLEYPALVVEVLSPSTGAVDRREKWMAYRTLSSLHEYVLVDPDRPWVEVYARTDLGWVQRITSRIDEAVTFESVELTVAMTTVYEGVQLPAEPEAAAGDPEF